MNIHESAEDYLEAILRLRESKGFVRSVDIAVLLGVTKPSVSFAMKKLREHDYIVMGEDNLITLTEKGEQIALRVYDRHKTIMSFLQLIGVSEETARDDACKIEHDISEESIEALRRQLLRMQASAHK